MKQISLFLLSLVLLGCSQNQNNSPRSIEELFEEFSEKSLEIDPILGAYIGDTTSMDLLPNNLTLSFQEERSAYYSLVLAELSTFDRNQLKRSEQINYDILELFCKTKIETDPKFEYYFPIDQIKSKLTEISSFGSGTSIQPFKTVQDYDNWISRLSKYSIWLDSAQANMTKGMANGMVLPKSIVKKVIPQVETMKALPLESNLFYKPLTMIPASFTEEDKNRITRDLKRLIAREIIPKFQRLHSFLRDEYIHVARETSGIGALPGGKEYYQNQILFHTTINLSADSIFNLGINEVARIEGEMKKVMDELEFEGSIKEFLSFVRTKSSLMPYNDPQQVIDNFNRIHEKMKPNLEKLFDLSPKTPFEVRRVEQYREKSASAHYQTGKPDGSRPGVFYVPIPDIFNYNIVSDESLFLHEAIPGHHYQIMIMLEAENLPKLRQVIYSGSFLEGWALYSESLGKELGLYTDPYQYFGMLGAEMHRAIRLVVDVGIHHKGWTREEAIQYSLDHEAESEESITAEIERYMVWPGQALSYKIGQITILNLRRKAEKELGDKFDIKEFHRVILETYGVPMEILTQIINEWIESKK